MTRVTQQPGFVLHHYPYGETSLILEVFTRDYGRLGLIAKGARRARSEVRAHLGPFQALLVGWSGRGELPVLTQVEAGGQRPLHLSGTGLLCGFYVNELVLRLTQREDPHEVLFAAYDAALSALASDNGQEAALRIFEKRLLRAVGYGLLLERDIDDEQPIAADADYRYLVDRGPRRAVHGREGIPIRGTSLLALRDECLSEPTALAEAKILLRAALAPHVGDKPLHTRRLFQRMRAAPAPEAR